MIMENHIEKAIRSLNFYIPEDIEEDDFQDIDLDEEIQDTNDNCTCFNGCMDCLGMSNSDFM